MAGVPTLPSTRSETDRPPAWSAALVLILPFLPAIATVIAYRIGISSGCSATGDGPCAVAGVDLADFIQKALAASWLVIFGIWVPAIIATGIIHRAIDGFGPRMIAGGLLPSVAIVGSVIAPTVAAAAIKPDACTLTALSTDCKVFGLDSQQAFALAGIQPWPLLLAAIPAAVYFVAYLVILSMATVAERRHAQLQLKAAILAAQQAGLPPPLPGQFEKKPARVRKPLVYIPQKRRRPPQSPDR